MIQETEGIIGWWQPLVDRWLAYPTDDPILARKGYYLSVITLSFAAVSALSVPAWMILLGPANVWLLVYAAPFIFFLLYFLTRRGLVNLVGTITIAIVAIFTINPGAGESGAYITPIGLLILALVVVLSGLLISVKSMFLVAGIAGILSGVATMHNQSIGNSEVGPVVIVFYPILAGLTHLLLKQLQSALNQSQAYARRLEKNRDDLTYEISERIKAERILQDREAILEAISFATTQLLQSPNWEMRIEMVIERLGQATNVSRVNVFKNQTDPGGIFVAHTLYNWHRPDQSIEANHSGLNTIAYEATAFGRWSTTLRRGEIIAGPIRTFSAHEQTWLTSFGIKSILMVPIIVGRDWWGMISFADHTAEREWGSVIIGALKTVANNLGTAIQRYQTMVELRQSEERFRRVVTSIGDHVYMYTIDDSGQPTNGYLSPNIEALTGYPYHNFSNDLSFWPTTVIHPADKNRAAAQAAKLASGQNSETEYRLIQADGEIIWVRDNGQVYPAGGGLKVYGVVSDITEYMEAQEALKQEKSRLAQRVEERTAELQRANAELARASRLKDEFLANMSHELRTPLNAVLGLSEVLTHQIYGPLNQEQLQAMDHIQQGGQHLLDLINDILDLAKIGAGKLKLSPEIVNVHQATEDSFQVVRLMAQKKNIKLFSAFDGMVETVWADRRRLKQMLINLLSNAIKFTPLGGQVGLEVSGDDEQQQVHFTIWDTGIGIPAADIDQLFTPFFQVDSSLSRQYEGSGLGLSLVLRLAEMHGGGVVVESEVEQGSRFTINLPWVEFSDDQVISATISSSEIPPAQLMSLEQTPLASVLLVEDNEISLIATRDFLQANGYRVIAAHNGLEAIERAEQEVPDIILMDIHMPTMDGLEATRHIREIDALVTTPIIALTALAMPEDRTRCFQAGANDYLSKPILLSKLRQVIETHLAV